MRVTRSRARWLLAASSALRVGAIESTALTRCATYGTRLRARITVRTTRAPSIRVCGTVCSNMPLITGILPGKVDAPGANGAAQRCFRLDGECTLPGQQATRSKFKIHSEEFDLQDGHTEFQVDSPEHLVVRRRRVAASTGG